MAQAATLTQKALDDSEIMDLIRLGITSNMASDVIKQAKFDKRYSGMSDADILRLALSNLKEQDAAR